MSWVENHAADLMEPKQRARPGEKEIFEMVLTSRQLLTSHHAAQEIYHISLAPSAVDLSSYQPGDCLAIYPQNQKRHISQILDALITTDAQEPILEGRSGRRVPLSEYLLVRANLTTCSASLAIALARALKSNDASSEFFKKLCLDPAQRSALLQFCRARTVPQLLSSFPHLLTAQQLADHLQPLLPRLYSIASASQWADPSVDLTVSYVQTGGKWPRQGVCSHWLCRDLQVGQHLNAHFHPHRDFHPPSDLNQSIIMIGGGTGIAPFRGFLQQRALDRSQGRNWLIMGQRQRQKDFLYQDFLQVLELAGRLRLDLAFSRDQAEKYYVSHAMERYSEDIAKELKAKAVIYVCGSIALGKSVHQALLSILQEQLSLDALQAEHFLRTLRKQGRYKRDVY